MSKSKHGINNKNVALINDYSQIIVFPYNLLTPLKPS